MPHTTIYYKNKFAPAVLLLLAIILLFLCSKDFYQVIFASAPPYSPPLTRIETGEKVVAITFDTEWNTNGVERLLAVLTEYQTKATFFVTGNWAEKHPVQLRAIAEAGHELGNHSSGHPHMRSLSPQAVQAEILECNNTIRSISGKKPACFRPPYGEYGDDTLKAAAKFSMKTILWNIDSSDWKHLSPASIAQTVLPQCAPGSILLFHSGALNTPEALKIILPALQAQGYKIVTVSELIAYQAA